MSVKKAPQDAAPQDAPALVPLPIGGGSYQLINGQLVKDAEPEGDATVKEN
jgi:hypothetical protein